jgi:hypothetical protein
MARAKHTNWVKAKVWTPTLTMEFEGSRISAAVEIFGSLSADDRAKALELMKERDSRLIARAAERQQKGGAQ